MTKKARQLRGPLRGLWHKHYFQANFMIRNLLQEAGQMAKDGRREKMLEPHYGKNISECINQISHQMVIGAYQRRAQDQSITGAFIVYAPEADGSNDYLTLGRHGDWDNIRVRADNYRRSDALDSPG